MVRLLGRNWQVHSRSPCRPSPNIYECWNTPISFCTARTDERTGFASPPVPSVPCERLPPGLNNIGTSGKRNSTLWKPTCWRHRKRSKTLIIPSVPDPGTTLVLRRTFKATRQQVFRAWITPRALESWMSFRGMAVTVRSLDARVGGSFRFEVEDGSLITGTYLHIVPPEKLVFTWVGGIRQDMETVVTL